LTIGPPQNGVASDSSGNLFLGDSDQNVEECAPPLFSCKIISAVSGAGGIAFIPGFLAIANSGAVKYYTYPGLRLDHTVTYYNTHTTDRFMTSDAAGALYVPYYGGIGGGGTPSPAVVVVPASASPYPLTSGLSQPFGAAAGP
jgi:hypothetical protein